MLCFTGRTLAHVPRHSLDGYSLQFPNWIILNNEPYGTFTIYNFSEMDVAQCQRSFSLEVCANGVDECQFPARHQSISNTLMVFS